MITINKLPGGYRVEHAMADLYHLVKSKDVTRIIGREEVGVVEAAEHVHLCYRARKLHRWKALKMQLDSKINKQFSAAGKQKKQGNLIPANGLADEEEADDDDTPVSTDWKPLPLGQAVQYMIMPSKKKPNCTLGRLGRWYFFSIVLARVYTFCRATK